MIYKPSQVLTVTLQLVNNSFVGDVVREGILLTLVTSHLLNKSGTLRTIAAYPIVTDELANSLRSMSVNNRSSGSNNNISSNSSSSNRIVSCLHMISCGINSSSQDNILGCGSGTNMDHTTTATITTSNDSSSGTSSTSSPTCIQ